MKTGSTVGGSSGSIVLRTGSATSGTAGSISVAVGSGNTDVGGRVIVTAGESTTATGGAVSLSSATGSNLEWLVSLRTAISSNAGASGAVAIKTGVHALEAAVPSRFARDPRLREQQAVSV